MYIYYVILYYIIIYIYIIYTYMFLFFGICSGLLAPQSHGCGSGRMLLAPVCKLCGGQDGNHALQTLHAAWPASTYHAVLMCWARKRSPLTGRDCFPSSGEAEKGARFIYSMRLVVVERIRDFPVVLP